MDAAYASDIEEETHIYTDGGMREGKAAWVLAIQRDNNTTSDRPANWGTVTKCERLMGGSDPEEDEGFEYVAEVAGRKLG